MLAEDDPNDVSRAARDWPDDVDLTAHPPQALQPEARQALSEPLSQVPLELLST